MLHFVDRDARGTRRRFLQVSGSSLASLGILGRTRANTTSESVFAPTDVLTGKSVIFLFLHGGPSQFETFDPKMEMPEGIRSATGEIKTSLPGVTFGSSFPKLASLADQLTLVRSYVPGDPNHNLKPLVGRDTFEANPGAIVSRVAGPNHPVSGLPTNVLLFPPAVDPETQPGISTFGRFDATGPLSLADAPFIPNAGSGLELPVPMERLDDRRLLLDRLGRAAKRLDRTGEDGRLNLLREQAYRLLSGGLAEAFDLNHEDPRVVARYDTAPLVHPDTISKEWRNRNNYIDNAKTVGKLLLLARRLCERGARFVTVTTNFVWDMHSDVNNAPMVEGMGYMGPPLDHALSAFIEDTRARGLDNEILLVACGEMGRTPRINAKGGRDHWGGLGPLLLYGAGMPRGGIIGKAARDGSTPQTAPMTNRHISATLLHTLFDVAELRLLPDLPREYAQVMAEWDPIPGTI